MLTNTDKRDRAPLFRARLAEAMETAGMNRSALARAVGADRSTVSALLSDEAARLPSAQLAANCAAALEVSLDWLMGLTERPERPGALLDAAVRVTQAERAPADETLLAWHREAAGYKIRHVPATLPDILKTPAMLEWEYAAFLGRTTGQAIGASEDRMELLGANGSEHEIALPLDHLASLASGSGYYADCPRDVRLDQLDWMADSVERLFPTLRLSLFDSRRVYSAPVSVFGPLIGVVYVGRFYLAFRETRRVRALTEHFDGLVREAEIDGRAAAVHIAALRTGA
jgi:transcriptional regulator with XRE-family HTH domain